jgi:hypothetical protein
MTKIPPNEARPSKISYKRELLVTNCHFSKKTIRGNTIARNLRKGAAKLSGKAQVGLLI